MFFENILDFEFENIFDIEAPFPWTNFSLIKFEGISDLTLLWPPLLKGLTAFSTFLPMTKLSVFREVHASFENNDVFGYEAEDRECLWSGFGLNKLV